MEKQDLLTKILALLGTVLVWLPLLVPVIYLLVSLISERIPNFDY